MKINRKQGTQAETRKIDELLQSLAAGCKNGVLLFREAQ